jgi:STE24 endopeptidase
VLAHEIGHFRRGHIKQRLAAGILQTAVIFFLLGLATDPDGRFARLLFDAFGVEQISPHVGLVLFTILLEPVSKLSASSSNAWSRRHEFEADAYAAEVTGDGIPLSSGPEGDQAQAIAKLPSRCAPATATRRCSA